jgi:hypothetical protein
MVNYYVNNRSLKLQIIIIIRIDAPFEYAIIMRKKNI